MTPISDWTDLLNERLRCCFLRRLTGIYDMAYLNGVVPVSVPVTEEQKFNLPAMKEKIGENKNRGDLQSNNPTGTYVPIGELEAFADTLPEDVLLVMDEAYMEFATEPDCCSMVDYMKAHPEKPILVLRTFPNIMRWQAFVSAMRWAPKS